MLLLLLLSRFGRVRLCVTPETAAHQAPLSLGFSRQEHWSGLPFPSPMHQSEKWKRSCSVLSNSSRPHGLQPTRLLRPWDFPGKSTGVGCHCLLRTDGSQECNTEISFHYRTIYRMTIFKVGFLLLVYAPYCKYWTMRPFILMQVNLFHLKNLHLAEESD